MPQPCREAGGVVLTPPAPPRTCPLLRRMYQENVVPGGAGEGRRGSMERPGPPPHDPQPRRGLEGSDGRESGDGDGGLAALRAASRRGSMEFPSGAVQGRRGSLEVGFQGV